MVGFVASSGNHPDEVFYDVIRGEVVDCLMINVSSRVTVLEGIGSVAARRSARSSPAVLPATAAGSAMVVSGGVDIFAGSSSLKATTDMSRGMDMPRVFIACMRYIAVMSS